MEDTRKLNASQLGTKKYWDEFYALERDNFSKNPEDTGECWFDDNGAEERMVEFLVENIGQEKIDLGTKVIDLGTGNGHLLFELYENEFAGPMLGVDYSEESVEFAREISKSNGCDDKIKFAVADIFAPDWNPGLFDLVLDKGTLDAIALCEKTLPDGRRMVDGYSKVVEKLLDQGGIFLITSCNFTEDELISIVETNRLKVWKTIEYPVYEFGGVKGTTICSVAFIKQ
ncbi:hypothetical protein HG537_0D05930 [Torulaspora globosa]|uniref:Protein-lysine N-methyltransferase EFM4 n=1 Tax=Torulaspora globosa TaxID=48254 RepID=A0A7H9HW35_9SACH|nr:hypothetical protein HG537_0D05930 [Torulaspora sp. CBS 2947]